MTGAVSSAGAAGLTGALGGGAGGWGDEPRLELNDVELSELVLFKDQEPIPIRVIESKMRLPSKIPEFDEA